LKDDWAALMKQQLASAQEMSLFVEQSKKDIIRALYGKDLYL